MKHFVSRQKCFIFANMDTDTLITAISTLGFPIVMCCALFWFLYQSDKRHTEETGKLRDTLENNTNVLTELTTLIKHLLK